MTPIIVKIKNKQLFSSFLKFKRKVRLRINMYHFLALNYICFSAILIFRIGGSVDQAIQK